MELARGAGGTGRSILPGMQALACNRSRLPFCLKGGPFIAATCTDDGLIGPATLYPRLSTPAIPGETIVIYANGFRPTFLRSYPGLVRRVRYRILMPTVRPPFPDDACFYRLVGGQAEIPVHGDEHSDVYIS